MDYIGVFEAQAHGYSEDVIIVMRCYCATYLGELKACSEIEEFKWLNYSDKDKVSAVDKLIFQYLKEKGLLM
jgi:8-oxo-dGTP diphosphatase